MTDTEYLEIMVLLCSKLEEAASAEPYDPDAYNKVIDRIQNVKPPWEQRPRRQPWEIIVFVLSLLCLLAYIVWEIVHRTENWRPL